MEVFLALHAVDVLTDGAVELGLDVPEGDLVDVGAVGGGAAGEVVAHDLLLGRLREVQEVFHVRLGDGLAALLEGALEEGDAHDVLPLGDKLDDAVLVEDVLAVVEGRQLLALVVLAEVGLQTDLAEVLVYWGRVLMDILVDGI